MPKDVKKMKKRCPHDHKNAIQVGAVDYKCQLCGELIDPFEWFLMNSFTFVDEVMVDKNKTPAKKGGGIAKNARRELESKTGKSVVTGQNYLPTKTKKKKLK